MEHFYQAEDRDGVRFSWNIWPSSRIEYKKIVAPIACMYTPLKRGTNVPMVYYNPVHCVKCGAYLNPYCKVDLGSNFWSCPFCFHRNPFPAHYAGISETKLPAEILPQCTSIEYRLPSPPTTPPVFLFVVDTVLHFQDELAHLKLCLLQALHVIPQNAFVGLVTFGANVQVYELSFPYCRRCIVFSGETDTPPANVQTLLGIPSGVRTGVLLKNRYILPLSEAEFVLTSILEELQLDPHPFKKLEERPACATGAAISVGLALMEGLFPKTGGRIIVMSGSLCTVGPGTVASRSLSDPIRSHHHLRKEEAKYVAEATAFYTKLATRAVTQGHVIDIFSASLDQTGLLEMHSLSSYTGGLLVSTESFTHDIVKQSLRKLFDKDEDDHLAMRFNATLEIMQSKEIKVCGAIGHLQSLEKKTSHVAENVVGVGGTSMWKMCGLDSGNSYAFYFEVVNQHNVVIPQDQYGVIQFRTSYQHPSGDRILRVTTVAKQWAPPSAGLTALLPGFDQEACAALIARYAVFKAENEEAHPLKWLDRHLIQLIHQFGVFQKDIPDSCTFPSQISLYPEFMFHLRRGNFIQVFGNSPDETSYFRHYLLRENVANCLIMIQPSLDSYAFDEEEPKPVHLSLDSVKPDRILLLDHFFHVVIYSGDNIAAWRKAGYQDKPEYESFKQLLEAPLEDAESIVKNRFPMPMKIVCDKGMSQGRFLLALLDPGKSTTSRVFMGSSPTPGVPDQQEIYSDDVPLQTFMEHLKKKVVSYEP